MTMINEALAQMVAIFSRQLVKHEEDSPCSIPCRASLSP